MTIKSISLFESVGIRKKFGGIVALKNVTFSVSKKGIYGFYGGNGSGKTTLFDIASGLVKPDEGYMNFQGIDITDLSPIKRGALHLGFTRTFQDPRLYFGMTALENAVIGYNFTEGITSLGALLRRKYWQKEYNQAVDQARHYFSLFSLERVDEKLGKELSFGQKKRLELVRAFISPAKTFWLDEPFAGLDMKTVFKTIETIIQCVTERNATLLFIDHREELVKEISNQAFHLIDGEIMSIKIGRSE